MQGSELAAFLTESIKNFQAQFEFFIGKKDKVQVRIPA